MLALVLIDELEAELIVAHVATGQNLLSLKICRGSLGVGVVEQGRVLIVRWMRAVAIAKVERARAVVGGRHGNRHIVCKRPTGIGNAFFLNHITIGSWGGIRPKAVDVCSLTSGNIDMLNRFASLLAL